MAKSAYVGVEGIARKVKKIYAGVDGAARKVRKGYVGVGGVARPFWTGGEVAYYGRLDNLTWAGNYYPTGASNPKYIVISGTKQPTGSTNGGRSLETYDVKTLTHSFLENAFPKVRVNSAAAEVGDYAVFGGSRETTSEHMNTATYGVDSNLTVATAADVAEVPSGSASFPGYAMFYEGLTLGLYDQNLTKTVLNMPGFSSKYQTTRAACQRVKSKIVMKVELTQPKGSTSSSMSREVYALDENLTISYVGEEAASRNEITSCANENYAIFAGGSIGYNGIDSYSNIVTAYNANLTMQLPAPLPLPTTASAPVSLQGSAGVAGGTGRSAAGSTAWLNTVTLYDGNLVQDSSKMQLVASRYKAKGASNRARDLALVFGGNVYPVAPPVTAQESTKIVEAFVE